MYSILAPAWLLRTDSFVAALILPLAILILISGLDDLIVDAVWVWGWVKSKSRKASTLEPASALEKRIAIFVPLWKEHAVIASMLEHNIAAIHYDNYDFFVGVYPNDERTMDVVRDVEERFPRVHLAICPHDGPTSKADCLNWVYQRMLLHEEQHNIRHDIVVTHDAEDLIHPDALRMLNCHSDKFDMVQIPVLPLPTPALDLVHGIYCDEFAESQTKDMVVRGIMGTFIPSAGVGTGYSREALEKLALASSNRVFEPVCLTEDYENGMRLHALGCPQTFLSLRANVATREYFPRNVRSAIRQRTRWVTGISLQTWDRHGWKGSAAQIYWLWRDRKGLLGNPLSLAANAVFVWGVATCWWTRGIQSLDPRLAIAILALLLYRTAIRMVCVGRIYGPLFALGVPLRGLCANYINAMASFHATFHFARAKIRREPLVWLKTEHGYPSRNTLLEHKRDLGEILTGSGYISEEDLREALRNKPPEMLLGWYLVLRGKLDESDLFEAISLQQGLPMGALAAADVSPNAARALPRHLVRTWRVLPFSIKAGALHLATSHVPTDEMTRELRGFTGLNVRFQLVTTQNFEMLLDLL